MAPAPATGPEDGSPRSGGNSKACIRLANIHEELKAKREVESGKVKPPWIKTSKADMTFGSVILLNTVFIGIDLEVEPSPIPNALWVIESMFLVVFLIEVSMRIHVVLPRIQDYFDAWGCFDLFVTVLGMMDAWVVTPMMGVGGDNPMASFSVLRIFRLVRLIRLIRVLRMFSELVVLLQTIAFSVKAVAWMSLLLSMIMYTGSVITVLLIGEQSDDEDVQTFFGSLGVALFSHFCAVTLEGWPDVARTAMARNRLWAMYWIGFILISNFTLVNLMVGVIVEKIITLATEQERALDAFKTESDQFRHTLRLLFDSADLDHSGEITRDEVRQFLLWPATLEVLQTVGINVHIPTHILYTIMDLDREGPTNFDEFFSACLRLCGTRQNIHSVMVQHDVCEAECSLGKRLDSVEEQILHLGALIQESLLAPPPAVPIGFQSSTVPQNVGNSPEVSAVMRLLQRMEGFGEEQKQLASDMSSFGELAKMSEEEGSIVTPPSAIALGYDVPRVPEIVEKIQKAAASNSIVLFEKGPLCTADNSLWCGLSNDIFCPRPRRDISQMGGQTSSQQVDGQPTDVVVRVRQQIETEYRTSSSSSQAPQQG